MTITLRNTVSTLALMLALTVTGAASAAPVSPAGPANDMRDAPPPAARADMPPPPPGMGARFGGPGHGGPAIPAIRTIEEIAHLYRVGGHPENVLPFYRETLTQARDPMVRHHLRDAIAREELKPADTAAAIATLRAQLSEDLAALPPGDAKRR
ncbi:hypothetical protein [Pandoraea pnomenusa]|uniref:hypothetical protein n=1 Tax=Pandoraea pnomenusa TaxID=93220 RepID=UPI00333FDF2A